MDGVLLLRVSETCETFLRCWPCCFPLLILAILYDVNTHCSNLSESSHLSDSQHLTLIFQSISIKHVRPCSYAHRSVMDVIGSTYSTWPPHLSCSMHMVWFKYIAKALYHVSFSFRTLLSIVTSNVICIITENMPLPFFANSHIFRKWLHHWIFNWYCCYDNP